MPWNSFERAYFFGTECALQNDECMSDQEHALVSHSAGVDQAFIERYCAPPAGKYPGTVDRLGNVPIAVARCVLDRLARILPHGASGSLASVWPGQMQPTGCSYRNLLWLPSRDASNQSFQRVSKLAGSSLRMVF